MSEKYAKSDSGQPKSYCEELEQVLESWPLYRKYSFQGGKVFILPTRLRLRCERCGGERNWEIMVPAGSGSGSRVPPPPIPVGRTTAPPTALGGYGQRAYTCRDCGKETVTYFYCYYWKLDADSYFLKVGQHPPLGMDPPAEIAKNLDKDDSDLYRKALTSRNFGYGIGALAYLRRIVENKMNDLLDLIEEAVRQDGGVPEELNKLEEVKKSWRFDDKITYAAKALPAHLRRDGINPLDFLHDLASEGLHHENEDNCVEIFDRCKNAFEYVFRQLRVEIDDAKAYIATLKPTR